MTVVLQRRAGLITDVGGRIRIGLGNPMVFQSYGKALYGGGIRRVELLPEPYRRLQEVVVDAFGAWTRWRVVERSESGAVRVEVPERVLAPWKEAADGVGAVRRERRKIPVAGIGVRLVAERV